MSGHSHRKRKKRDDSDGHKRSRSKAVAEDEDKVKAALEYLQQNSQVVLLTEDDFFAKNGEFREWLRDKKGIYLADLSKKQAGKQFKRFVRKWNEGSLSTKYYKWKDKTGSKAAEQPRTKFSWNIQTNDNESQYIQSVKKDGRREERSMIEQHKQEGDMLRKRKELKALASGDPESDFRRPESSIEDRIGRVERQPRPAGDEDMDEEDRCRYERGVLKKERKRHRRTHEAVLEELVPKKTGRERMLEKKKMKGAYARADRDDEKEISDSDLLGGASDSFRKAVSARNARFERRKQSQQDERAQKLAEYRRKEDEKMAVFREMLKNKSGGGFVSGGVEHT